jgi:regulator of protease activity HflC (stomatin/prohibitin superfamily)
MRRMSIDLPLILVMIVAIVAVAVVAKSVVVVPGGKAFVLSSLGRPTRVLQAGLHVLPPFVTSIAARVPVDEQTLDVPETGGHLGDGTAVVVKGSIRYRVFDPLVAITNVADYQHALAEVARTHWRRALEEAGDAVSFDPSLGAALPAIRAAAASWGIEAIDAAVQTTMSEEGVRALQEQAAREREQRVLEWLAQRQEPPGPDGSPTWAKLAAYKAWAEQAVIEHREEIEAAARAERPQ